MQTPEFLTDVSDDPWAVTPPRYLHWYANEEQQRILSGIYMMLTPGVKSRLMVPLMNPVSEENPFQYAVFIRNDRMVTALHLEVGFSRNGVNHTTRPLVVPQSVKDLFPYLTFTTGGVDMVECDRLLWKVLRESWDKAFDMLLLDNPRIALTGLNGVGIFLGQEEWTAQGAVNPQTHMITRSMRNRVGFYLQLICHPDVSQTRVMINDKANKTHFVALISSGSTVNMVDVRFVPYPNPCIIERKMFFPQEFARDFPAIQFTSVRLSDAEKNELMMEPVRRHYWTMTDKYFVMHSKLFPMLLALAMGLHARLGGRSLFEKLGRDVTVVIARIIRDEWA